MAAIPFASHLSYEVLQRRLGRGELAVPPLNERNRRANPRLAHAVTPDLVPKQLKTVIARDVFGGEVRHEG